MANSRAEVLATCGELNARIEYGNIGLSGCYEILIDAPDGQHWMCDGIHQLVVSQWDHQPVSELWDDALDRIGYGLELCDESCDASLEDLEIAKGLVRDAIEEDQKPAN